MEDVDKNAEELIRYGASSKLIAEILNDPNRLNSYHKREAFHDSLLYYWMTFC